MAETFSPFIVRETSSGFIRSSICDDMLDFREIELAGEIDDPLANEVIRQMRYLERVDSSAPITVFINSIGGVISSGLAIYDTMQALRCPVHTVCQGLAASMAAVLLAAGDHRMMLAHANVMIHDPLVTSPGISGNARHLESKVRNIMETRELMASILAKHTGRTLREVYEKTANDTYFDAREAIAFGLADGILERF